MALSKRQSSVAEAIKGKVQGLMMFRKQDAKTDLLIKKTVNEISGLFDSYDLWQEKELVDVVTNALVRVKKFGMASAFAQKQKKR